MNYKWVICFRWDINLPALLDYEIWKSSNMIFQPIPNTKQEERIEKGWDDAWHHKKYSLVLKDLDVNSENNQI